MYNVRHLRTLNKAAHQDIQDYIGKIKYYSTEWHLECWILSFPLFSSPSTDVTVEEGWLPGDILSQVVKGAVNLSRGVQQRGPCSVC